MMNYMLSQTLAIGTAKRATAGTWPAAGKTGTSQDYRDAWFLGYSAYLAGGVWVGNDDNSPTKKVTGGGIPAAIWKDIMQPAHAGLQYASLPGDYGTVAQQDSGGIFDIFRQILGGRRASRADDMEEFIDQFDEPQPSRRRQLLRDELKKQRQRR
jgi:membrane peptidoglycan carboxypeptidase